MTQIKMADAQRGNGDPHILGSKAGSISGWQAS